MSPVVKLSLRRVRAGQETPQLRPPFPPSYSPQTYSHSREAQGDQKDCGTTVLPWGPQLIPRSHSGTAAPALQ